MAKTLSEFTIDGEGDSYLIRISTDDGEQMELNATYEQLDLIAEAIEDRLDEDEEDKLAVENEA